LKDLKGSKTEKNLMAAFAGESQARNKYDYFAKVARKENLLYIAKIFEETAMNEHQHAKDEFKELKGIGDTEENLLAAMEGEKYETEEMYPEFAQIAIEEGFDEIADMFKQIAKIEKEHQERYARLLDMLKKGTVYKREKKVKWVCSKCGFVHYGEEPPEVCPACKHPKEYYEPSDI